jgi:hypothetical protein
MSAIGSVIELKLPTGFYHARHFAFQRKFTETNAADIEPTHIGTLSPTPPTTPHNARAKLRLYE